MAWTCEECCDTATIDRGGAEIPCPYCQPQPVTVRITGLRSGLGLYGARFRTATESTSTTITFVGTPDAIRADVTSVARYHTRSSVRRSNSRAGAWATAIATRVIDALKEIQP